MPRKKKPLPTVTYERMYRIPSSGRARKFKELEGSGWHSVVQEELPITDYFIEERERRFHDWASYDLHRWIARLWAKVTEGGFQEPTPKTFYDHVVVPIIETHGDIFQTIHAGETDPELLVMLEDIGKYDRFIESFALYTPPKKTLNQWREAIRHLYDVVQLAPQIYKEAIEDERPEGFDWWLQNQMKTAYGSNEFMDGITLEYVPTGQGMVLKCYTLLDWCWLLLLRDQWQEIEYTTCEGCYFTTYHSTVLPRKWVDDLMREVPSTTPPNKRDLTGRSIKVCGSRCGEQKRAWLAIEKSHPEGFKNLMMNRGTERGFNPSKY